MKLDGENQSTQNKSKELIKQQFGREATKYVTSHVHASQSDLDFILELIQPQPHWVFLDIATGTGHLALTLAPHLKHVTASDITREMLNEAESQARKKHLDNFVTAEVDVHHIPYSSNSFDLVASRIAPHHFYDIDTAISEMVRVLKPGGFIFIQDTLAPEEKKSAEIFNRIEKLRDPSHVRDLNSAQWISILSQHGCEVEVHHTKPKDWPLRWWTERMSTPEKNVEQIIEILEDIYESHKDSIHIQRLDPYPEREDAKIDAWSLHPLNGYFLAKKLE